MLLTGFLLTAPLLSAFAQYDGASHSVSAEGMTVDLLLIRPLGIASTILGSVLYVVSLPLTLPTGTADVAGEKFVKEPVQFTFIRPLGQFGSYPP
jgi:hypothetical protein